MLPVFVYNRAPSLTYAHNCPFGQYANFSTSVTFTSRAHLGSFRGTGVSCHEWCYCPLPPFDIPFSFRSSILGARRRSPCGRGEGSHYEHFSACRACSTATVWHDSHIDSLRRGTQIHRARHRQV